MDVNDANSFVCCYDISGVALPKCEAFSNISSGIFGKALNVMIFTYLHTNFAKDDICLEILVLLKSQRHIDTDL